jgi:hypothetical protein
MTGGAHVHILVNIRRRLQPEIEQG